MAALPPSHFTHQSSPVTLGLVAEKQFPILHSPGCRMVKEGERVLFVQMGVDGAAVRYLSSRKREATARVVVKTDSPRGVILDCTQSNGSRRQVQIPRSKIINVYTATTLPAAGEREVVRVSGLTLRNRPGASPPSRLSWIIDHVLMTIKIIAVIATIVGVFVLSYYLKDSHPATWTAPD